MQKEEDPTPMRLYNILKTHWGEENILTDEDDNEEYLPHSIMTDNLPIILKPTSKKKKEHLKKQHYNILIYQILPTPPNTKEPHNLSKLN